MFSKVDNNAKIEVSFAQTGKTKEEKKEIKDAFIKELQSSGNKNNTCKVTDVAVSVSPNKKSQTKVDVTYTLKYQDSNGIGKQLTKTFTTRLLTSAGEGYEYVRGDKGKMRAVDINEAAQSGISDLVAKDIKKLENKGSINLSRAAGSLAQRSKAYSQQLLSKIGLFVNNRYHAKIDKENAPAKQQPLQESRPKSEPSLPKEEFSDNIAKNRISSSLSFGFAVNAETKETRGASKAAEQEFDMQMDELLESNKKMSSSTPKPQTVSEHVESEDNLFDELLAQMEEKTQAGSSNSASETGNKPVNSSDHIFENEDPFDDLLNELNKDTEAADQKNVSGGSKNIDPLDDLFENEETQENPHAGIEDRDPLEELEEFVNSAKEKTADNKNPIEDNQLSQTDQTSAKERSQGHQEGLKTVENMKFLFESLKFGKDKKFLKLLDKEMEKMGDVLSNLGSLSSEELKEVKAMAAKSFDYWQKMSPEVKDKKIVQIAANMFSRIIAF